MNSIIDHFAKICKDALLLAHRRLKDLGEAGSAEIHTKPESDIVTRGDIDVSNELIRFLEKQEINAIVRTEESGAVMLHPEPSLTICIDDIDGTDNYYRCRQLLPHCTVISVFDSVEPVLADALVAAVIEHRSGYLWHAVRGKGLFLDNEAVRTSGKKVLNRRTLCIIDHYASSGSVKSLSGLYKNAWVKDFGSAAFHLAGTASGFFDAYVSTMQKGHELGAGYLFMEEAGGCILDFSGARLGSQTYDFNGTYGIVAAATDDLCEQILLRIS